MTALDIEKERTEFEAWVVDSAVGFKVRSSAFAKNSDGSYQVADMRHDFTVWLAAKRASQPVPRPLHETIVQDGAELVCTTCGTTSLVPGGGDGLTDEVRVTLESAAGYLDEYRKLLYEVKPADIEAHPYPPAVEQVADELRAIAAHISGQGGAVCGKCKGTGIESYHDHGAAQFGEQAIEPIRCTACDGFGRSGQGAEDMRRKAPWPDFNGQPIHEGDTIRHPSGEEGRVVFFAFESDPGEQWRVYYKDCSISRLCLQIGDKGRAAIAAKEDAR